MNKIFTYLFAAAIAFAVSSCISIRITDISVKLPVEPEYNLYTNGDSLLFIVKLSAPFIYNTKNAKKSNEGLDFINDISVIELDVYYKDKKLANHVKFNRIDELPGEDDNLSDSAVFCQYLIWSCPGGIERDSLRFGFSFVKSVRAFYPVTKYYREILKETANQSDKNKMGLHKSATPGLYLIPYAKKIDDNVEFGAVSIRTANVANEYIPTSENFRAEIFSPKNEKVWDSYSDKNFLQAITKVEPEKFGEKKNNSYIWDGKNKAGGKAIGGKYSVNMIIPSQPIQYSVFINFNRTDR